MPKLMSQLKKYLILSSHYNNNKIFYRLVLFRDVYKQKNERNIYQSLIEPSKLFVYK